MCSHINIYSLHICIYPPPGPGACGGARRVCLRSTTGVLMVWFWIVLRDPPPCSLVPFAATRLTFLTFFFDIVLVFHFFRILVPSWSEFTSQLGPKILKKSIQEPSNSIPTSILLSITFCIDFFIDFSLIFDPKIIKKSMEKQLKNHPNNITPKSCRCPWNPIKTNTFLRFLLCRQC